MKITTTLILVAITLGLVSCTNLNAANTWHTPDAVFESSDGAWTDCTAELKGRNFRRVLWHFEAYKLKENKPLELLVRITPTPESPVKKDDIKWKVPYGPSSQKATHVPRSLTNDEMEEITKRANKAYETWESM
jgi:hypothetical protein